LADDRQHLDGFVWRSVHQGYCASDLEIADIIDQADEKMFQLILTNANHVLSSLLPDETIATISEQDATTDNLLTNAPSSSVIILRYVCCIQTLIDCV